MKPSTEIWRPVPGLEDCREVSNLGRARSVARYITMYQNGIEVTKFYPSRVLKKIENEKGYLQSSAGKSGLKFLTHLMVYRAFKGPIPSGMTVNHKNGNKYDNYPENLELMTHAENTKHAWDTGLTNSRGELHGRAKLTAKDVQEIRAMPRSIATADIAEKYGVAYSTIYELRRGNLWKSLQLSEV